MAKIFENCQFYVNYNSNTNAEEVKKLYTDNIKNLHFTNDLQKNWGSVVKSMISGINTKYMFILCEDFIYDVDKVEFDMMMDSVYKHDVVYMPVGRLWKYSRKEYHRFYENVDELFLFNGEDYKGSSLSVDALYLTEDFKQIMKYYVNNNFNLINNNFKIHLPHHFEDVFSKKNKNDVKIWFHSKICAIPKREIFIHYNTEREYNRV